MPTSLYIYTGDTSQTGKLISGKISTVIGDTELKTVAAGEQELQGVGGAGCVAGEEREWLFFGTTSYNHLIPQIICMCNDIFKDAIKRTVLLCTLALTDLSVSSYFILF